QHRQRQPLHQPRDDAEHAAQADEQAGQQGVAAARAHVLVGGLADVGRGLGDAADEAGDQGRERLRQQDVAGAVIVARGARALADVDAADDHQQAERQQQRQERHGVRQAFDEAERGQRQHELQRLRGRPNEARRSQPQHPEAVEQHRAEHERDEHARQFHRQPALRHQHVQQQAERHEPDQRRAQRLDQRQEAHQHQRGAGDRTEQAGARNQPGDRVAGKGSTN
ncbi:hypothetical protein CATMIT_01776, partial [Catenibacterium mitsuokai DSM 15897]